MTSSILFFAAALFLAVSTGLLRNASLRATGAPPRIPERTTLDVVPGDLTAEPVAELGRAA